MNGLRAGDDDVDDTRFCSYRFRVDALLVEAEFDSMLADVQSGIDAIEFSAAGKFVRSFIHRNAPIDYVRRELIRSVDLHSRDFDYS